MSLNIHLVLFHRGYIDYSDRIKYEEGLRKDLGIIDSDEFSLVGIRNIVKSLGYSDKFLLHYKLSSQTFEDGLNDLKTKSDYMGMINAVHNLKNGSILEVYVEHGMDSPIMDVGTDSDDDDYKENDDEILSDDEMFSDDETNDEDIFMENTVVTLDDLPTWMGFQDKGKGSGTREKGSNSRQVENVDDVEDDITYSNELESITSSDKGKIDKGPKYNRTTDKDKTIVMEVGKAYPDQVIFREQLLQFALANGFDYELVKNEKRRVTAIYKQKDICKWRMHASWNTNETAFVIKTYQDKHECGAQFYNTKLTARWIADTFYENIKENPEISPEAVQALVKRTYNVFVSTQQCYRGKRRVLKKLFGNELQQYEKLVDYVEVLKKFNPGSRVVLKTNGQGQFLRIYICLEACKKGFLTGCRPFIGLDACHLKVYQQGQLFAAVGLDANDNIFPIAFGVCEIKNTETWKWFLGEMTKDLEPRNKNEFTFISDQQKGLDRALEEEIPGVDHRFCVRYLYNNYKKLFKGDILKNLMWEASRASTNAKFEAKMSELEQIWPEAAQWLRRIPAKQWSRHAFNERIRCASLLNNLCESFNSFIKDARDKPILVMLETIRRRLMERMNVKRNGMLTYDHEICPRILKILEKIRKYEREYIVRLCGIREFEVEHMHGEIHVVKLGTMECTCNKWQLTGIPCTHACAAIVRNKQRLKDYVYNCFSKTAFLSAYQFSIHGLPSSEYWPKSEQCPIKPPFRKRQPGRPKKKRNREEGEKHKHDLTKWKKANTTLRCGRCQEWGHNIRTCKGNPKSKKKNSRAGDNIQIIDLGDGRRQAVRVDTAPACAALTSSSTNMRGRRNQFESSRVTEICSQPVTRSQPQRSQECMFSQSDGYMSQQGPVTMPSEGAFWSGTPNPNPSFHMPYLVTHSQVREATARVSTKKK